VNPPVHRAVDQADHPERQRLGDRGVAARPRHAGFDERLQPAGDGDPRSADDPRARCGALSRAEAEELVEQRILRYPAHVRGRGDVDRLADRAVRFQDGRQDPHQAPDDLGSQLLVEIVAVPEDAVDDRPRHARPLRDVPDGHVASGLLNQFDRGGEDPLPAVGVMVIPARRPAVGGAIVESGGLRGGCAGHASNLPDRLVTVPDRAAVFSDIVSSILQGPGLRYASGSCGR